MVCVRRFNPPTHSFADCNLPSVCSPGPPLALAVDPGEASQLYIATVIAVVVALLTTYAAPFASASDAFLANLSSTSLVLTLVALLALETIPDAFDSVVGSLISAALVVIVTTFIMLVAQLNTARKSPLAQWEKSGMHITPRFLPSTAYHVFISHQWTRGQDQAKTIKSMLIALVPKLQVYPI